MKKQPKRYVLVGCGGRGLAMFALPIVQRFSSIASLVGVCDCNPGRMQHLSRCAGREIPGFTDFDEMMRTVKPDVVIVATPDCLHHDFILRAFKYGCDVISEKPLTIDEEKCRRILNAERKSGRKLTVIFNWRYLPYMARVRELLGKGVIGRILSVDFNYQLDRAHGADYFRRWHRRKEISGGLLLHKSSHHFDLVNWLLQQDPVEVFAMGSLQFYGPTRQQRGKRCLTCKHKRSCPYYFDITKTTVVGAPLDTNELYTKVEHYDGYIRDQCIFGEDINIEDTVTMTVRYSAGTQMSYSLNAHCTYEGCRLAFNGTEGRLEAAEWHSGPTADKDRRPIRIVRWKKPLQTIWMPIEHGDHGGADTRMHRMLFGEKLADPLGQMASSRAGAMSILTGTAANISMASRKPVRIADLLRGTPLKLKSA
jgi:predicted dehydrogenase